jgi:arginyl-tRNA synthetase
LPEDAAARVAFLRDAKSNVSNDPVELSLIRQIALFPRIVEAAALAHEPHQIAFYLYDLASEFHALWTKGAICLIYASLSRMMQK